MNYNFTLFIHTGRQKRGGHLLMLKQDKSKRILRIYYSSRLPLNISLTLPYNIDLRTNANRILLRCPCINN